MKTGRLFVAQAFMPLILGVAASAAAAPSPSPSPQSAASTVTSSLPTVRPSPAVSPSPNLGVPLIHADAALDSAMSLSDDTSNGQELKAVELPDLTLDKSGGITLTLEDSVRIAIRTATAVLKAQNDVEVNGAALLQSYGEFLPNLSAQGNYAYQTGTQYLTTGEPTTVNGSNLGAGFVLGTDLNIFNGLSDYATLKASLLRKDVANLSLYRAKQAVALDISQNFLQVVLDNQLVDIARKNLEESQAREKLLEEQTRVGAKNLSDLFRQQAQTSSDESLLLTSENKTRADQIFFLRKLRADVAKKYHFVDPRIPEEKADTRFQDEGNLLKVALANRTDLKASDETADAAHWDVKSDWGNYLPKLDLAGNVTSGGHYLYNQLVNGQNYVPPTQSGLGYQLGTQLDYTLGIYLSWTLFDRLVTHENVVKAQAVADDAEIDAQDFRNKVEGDVRLAFGSYETALQQLKASKKGLVAAEKAYEVIEGRYEVGSSTFIDLITAQVVLLQAESARAQALIDFMLQGKTVEFATGQINVD